MKPYLITALLAALLAATSAAWAQATPEGLWKTVDDNTQQERSQVRIAVQGGVYTGRIEKLMRADASPALVCEKCTDERKDKPLIGMALVRNVKQSAEDKEVFDGGDITDPDNGKVYRVRLKPLEAGKKLEVRGYLGPFYRTQIWIRAD
jgi:uncharacterized protein (DUF2147 family)